jgi:hypothetical protein
MSRAAARWGTQVARRAGIFLQFIWQLLREIGDENAYQRHLTAHNVEHSAAEWRRFCDERWLASSRRPRCC